MFIKYCIFPCQKEAFLNNGGIKMKSAIKCILSILAITTILAGLVFALPILPSNLPWQPRVASPAITDDGQVQLPSQLPESQLTKIVFVRYAPGQEKPCNNNGICDPDEKGWCSDCKSEEPAPTACYGFLSGAQPKWNWIEDYYYSGSSLGSSSSNAVTTWESATIGNIFGNGISGSYPWGIYDLVNSISYGNYQEPGVLGVTAIWYRGKNIYEYDIMFDTDYFPGTIDLDTVVLHEFGHAAGLDDLYNTVCIDEVMYGYYEGIKLALGNGDITGIRTLYG